MCILSQEDTSAYPEEQGIDFKMNTKVTSAERLGSGEIQVAMETVKGGETETLTCDTLLVSIGRRPYTKNLGLEVRSRMMFFFLI